MICFWYYYFDLFRCHTTMPHRRPAAGYFDSKIVKLISHRASIFSCAHICRPYFRVITILLMPLWGICSHDIIDETGFSGRTLVSKDTLMIYFACRTSPPAAFGAIDKGQQQAIADALKKQCLVGAQQYGHEISFPSAEHLRGFVLPNISLLYDSPRGARLPLRGRYGITGIVWCVIGLCALSAVFAARDESQRQAETKLRDGRDIFADCGDEMPFYILFDAGYDFSISIISRPMRHWPAAPASLYFSASSIEIFVDDTSARYFSFIRADIPLFWVKILMVTATQSSVNMRICILAANGHFWCFSLPSFDCFSFSAQWDFDWYFIICARVIYFRESFAIRESSKNFAGFLLRISSWRADKFLP